MTQPIKQSALVIGISSCLLGNKVRYDGDHCRHDEIIRYLDKKFTLMPFCPEVAIGLGVPRPPIQLIQSNGEIRVKAVIDPSQDLTRALTNYAHSLSEQFETISGYIFKSRSPSCGIGDVKVYDTSGELIMHSYGQFAKIIMQKYPDLPISDETRLSDSASIKEFLSQVKNYSKNKNISRA